MSKFILTGFSDEIDCDIPSRRYNVNLLIEN